VDHEHTIATNDDPDVWNQIYPLVWYHPDVFSDLACLTGGDERRLVLRADHSRESQNNREGTISKAPHVLRLAVAIDEAAHCTWRDSSEQQGSTHEDVWKYSLSAQIGSAPADGSRNLPSFD